MFAITHDPWDLLRSASYWRGHGEPERVLGHTNHLLKVVRNDNSKLLIAVLTVRGAAYADIPDLVSATECAERAMKIDRTNFFPFALMGAIYIQSGDGRMGERYFDMAIRNGAEQQIIDRQIHAAVRKASADRKRSVALYLVGKDRRRFSWALAYV